MDSMGTQHNYSSLGSMDSMGSMGRYGEVRNKVRKSSHSGRNQMGASRGIYNKGIK
jgi:hypothetical protein